ARRRHDRDLRLQDRALPRGARGDALRRLRCRAGRDGAGAVLLESRGAGRTRHRLGYALSARLRVGVLPRSGAHRPGAQAGDGGELSKYVFKLPDLGEGTVSAEIVNWRVKPGDTVAEDEIIVEVMTEKAAVEVPAPVSGRVLSTTGTPGDTVPVGAELIVLDTDPGAAAPPPSAATAAPPAAAPARARGSGDAAPAPVPSAAPPAPPASGRVATSPAIRRRAHEAGIDLRQVSGTGPNGRIVAKDLDAYVARRGAQPTPLRSAPKAVPS